MKVGGFGGFAPVIGAQIYAWVSGGGNGGTAQRWRLFRVKIQIYKGVASAGRPRGPIRSLRFYILIIELEP